MRAKEIITEDDNWTRMPPQLSQGIQQQFDQWDQEKRGKNALTTLPVPKQTPGYTFGPDSPYLEKTNKSNSTIPNWELKQRDRYAGAPDDEYKVNAPTRWGGLVPHKKQDTGREKSMAVQQLPTDKMEYDPKELRKLNKVPPSLPGGMKEKYRT
jgi:hypothetical protein